MDVSFEELDCLEKLLKTKKLTEKQRKTLYKLIQLYFYMID